MNATARDSSAAYSTPRYARCRAGTRAKARRRSAPIGWSPLGSTHGGVRWKIVTPAATGAIRGTNWTALAPVPTTATRLPRRSTSWRHCAEWNASPRKRSTPGSAGIEGRCSAPTPETRKRQRYRREGSPSGPVPRVSTVHVRDSSSQVAPVISVAKRTRRRRSWESATRSR